MNRLFLFLLTLVMSVTGMMADTASDEASKALVALGMENVRVFENGRGTVYACFETTGYRGTYHGAAAGLKELARIYPQAETFRVMILEDQMERVSLTASVADGQWHVTGSYDNQDIKTALRVKKMENSSAGKIDLTVYPMFSWINHRFTQPFEYALSIAPALTTSLWEGNRITLQPIFPVSYDLLTLTTEKYIRPGATNIAQDFVTKDGRMTATLTAGFFFYDRMGADLRIGYHVTPNLTIGAEASVTGDIWVALKKYHFEKIKDVSFLGKVDYYEPLTRLQGQVTGGRFVKGDYGARVDISRHFADYTIGLYGILTGGEHNAGFHFAIPFGPKHYKRNGAFRLKLPDYFDWEYSMVSYFKYYDEQMGQTVEMRPDENRSAHYWQPVHVAQYTEKILNGGLK